MLCLNQWFTNERESELLMMSKLITNVRKLEILMVIPSKVIRIIKGAALAVEIIRVE